MASESEEKGKFKIKTRSILEDYDVSWSQKLGTGISGPVRPCKNKVTGDQFALKCLYDRSRARQEISLHLKCCGSPHIVQIYDVYANEVQFPGEPQPRSRLLVVMELMDGGELFDRISRQKYFTEVQAANYTRQIALAIERCHTLNLAHRDIKPENLLLKNNAQDALVKLSDFGFAKMDDGNLTTPHFTPYYVAPQVLQAQKEHLKSKFRITTSKTPFTYDKSCDMWSLGVIVYIMLCGYPPFYSETPSKQITRAMKKNILAGNYDFPIDDWKHISPSARDLVTRLLKVEPEERLSVEGVLSHCWLKEAPLTQLQSPAVLLDKSLQDVTQAAHSEQLTAMRLPDSRVLLKPLTQVNNPILKKRLHPKQTKKQNSYEPPSKQMSRPSSSVSAQDVKALRDVIAHCILPAPGKKFKKQPDLQKFAHQISELLQTLQTDTYQSTTSAYHSTPETDHSQTDSSQTDHSASDQTNAISSEDTAQAHELQHLQISSEF